MPLYGIHTAGRWWAHRMSQMIRRRHLRLSLALARRRADLGRAFDHCHQCRRAGGDPAAQWRTACALVRREQMGKTLWSTHSADGGFTWTEPVQVTGDMRHPADLIVLKNDDSCC